MNTQEKQEAIEAIIESKKLALPWGKSREQYGAQQASHHQLLKKIASRVDDDQLFKKVLVKTFRKTANSSSLPSARIRQLCVC